MTIRRSRTSLGGGDYAQTGELELLLRLFFPGFYKKLQEEGMGRAQAMSKFEAEQGLKTDKEFLGAQTEREKELQKSKAEIESATKTKEQKEIGDVTDLLAQRFNMQLTNPPALSAAQQGILTKNLPEIQKALAFRGTGMQEFLRDVEQANQIAEQGAQAELLTKQHAARRAAYMPVGQGQTAYRINEQGLPDTGVTGSTLKSTREPVMSELVDKSGNITRLPTSAYRDVLTETPGHIFTPRPRGQKVGTVDFNTGLFDLSGTADGLEGASNPEPAPPPVNPPGPVNPKTVQPEDTLTNQAGKQISRSVGFGALKNAGQQLLTKGWESYKNFWPGVMNKINEPDRQLFQNQLNARAGVNPPMGNIPFAPPEPVGESLIPQEIQPQPQTQEELIKFLLTKPRYQRQFQMMPTNVGGF